MIALIIIVVSIVSSVFVININSSRKKLAELNEQKQRLQAEYDRQLKLAEELEKKKVYVKTNAYIEEQARKLGLIYPNEVIFKPSN
jgi:cell division protein FtsB